MKALLVFPAISLDERYGKKSVGEIGGHLPPLGLCYLAAMLEKQGIECKILDMPAQQLEVKDVLEEIKKFRPDFVGISALTPTISRTAELSKKIREKFPKVYLVIGGPHASLLPEQTLKLTNADFVITGEGEKAIVKIAKELKKLKRHSIIKGELIENLDELPMPARHLLDLSKYSALPNNYKKNPRVLNVLASRGCPFNCTFCCKTEGTRRYRVRSAENVIAELKELKEKYGIQEIAFWDDIFTIKREWVKKLCEKMIEEKIDFPWSCETRVQLVDKELLELMKKAGCWNIFYGIEAGDQTLLDNINKGIKLEDVRKAVKLTKEAGIEIRGSFMIGLPGETPELAEKTINFAIELDPDYAQFSITTPFPGTELYKTASKFGKLDENFENYNEWQPVFVPFGYKNAEEVVKMQKKAFKKFYIRPAYVLKRISKIRSPQDFFKNLKGLRMIIGLS
ncbi:MAG: radical SAM protein [Candidatus Diapherotrites archaeon]|nr:radical SAM protein [Candidatus Diapherotrites archaeon]